MTTEGVGTHAFCPPGAWKASRGCGSTMSVFIGPKETGISARSNIQNVTFDKFRSWLKNVTKERSSTFREIQQEKLYVANQNAMCSAKR